MSSSSGAAAGKKLIVLTCSDGVTFEVEEAVATQSQTIKQMMEDNNNNKGTDTSIALSKDMTSNTLEKVIEYCKRHVYVDGPTDAQKADLEAFDAEFVKVDQSKVFELALAANYLKISSLSDLTCKTMADNIKGKTPEEIRKMFNITNDFTPEEEAAIALENSSYEDDDDEDI